MSPHYTPEFLEISLPDGYIAIIDPVDGDLLQFEWKVTVDKRKCLFYVYRYEMKEHKWRRISLHATILERILERPLRRGELCDHKNTRTLDNRRSNLRIADTTRNRQNSRRLKTGLKGAYYDPQSSKPWKSSIRVKGRLVYLGNFNTEKEAHEAYCNAAKHYFGEFARCK
jgi:hypothetical protein